MKYLFLAFLIAFSAEAFADGQISLPTKNLTNFTYYYAEKGPQEGSCTYNAQSIKSTVLSDEEQIIRIQLPCDIQLEKYDSTKLVVELGGVWTAGIPLLVQKVTYDGKVIWKRAE